VQCNPILLRPAGPPVESELETLALGPIELYVITPEAVAAR
jgi:hypothetical protein